MSLQKRNYLATMENVLSFNAYALLGLTSGSLLANDVVYFLKYVEVKQELHKENQYTEISGLGEH